jgi:hypothetical protein
MSVVRPLRVFAGVEVAQICFHAVDQGGPVYDGGKYGNERNTTPKTSGMWREFLTPPTA